MSETISEPTSKTRPQIIKAPVRVPPHALEAEQAVLGGLMLNDEAWFNISDVITVKDFYRAQHRIIFDAMYSLASQNEPLDAITLSEWMQSKGVLDKAGGPGYLAELVENTPGASNVGAYAKIIAERSTLRQLISVANNIAESALDPQGRDSSELLETAEQQVFRIHEGHLRENGPENVKPLLERAVKRLETLFANGETVTGLPTGFDDLDKKTSGLQTSDLIIVAGRPSMGKSSLAMNLVEHALFAEKAEGAVMVFSMEMPSDQLVMRMLSSLGRIDQTKMRNGKMEPEDWDRFSGAVAQLKDRNLYIDDSPALSPNDLKTRARRVSREAGGLRLIVVDYLQLMRGSGKSDNRTGEISEISRSLKALAKEMECPVVALSQLNRSLESRPDKRPMMSDLRESGAIEQDADVILFIYRDEVYNPESEDKGLAELIIGKQRNGPIGMVKLTFIGHLTKFESYTQNDYDGYSMT